MKFPETARRLSTALTNANMRPQELANMSGVSKSSISQYVNGTHTPSNISSGKMAAILNVNPLWLMGFDVSMDARASASAAPFAIEELTPTQIQIIEITNTLNDSGQTEVCKYSEFVSTREEYKKEKI